MWTIIVYHVLSSSMIVTGHLLLWNGMTWVPDHQCDAATTKPELKQLKPREDVVHFPVHFACLLSQLLSWSTERHGTTRNVSRVLSIRMRFCVEFQPHADLCSNTRSFWIPEVSEVVWGDLWRLWAGPTGPTGPRGSVRVSRGVSAGTVPAVRSVMRI